MSVSIVIVNYNGRELLEPCLSAVLPQARELDAEVMVVDNGSRDGSVVYVKSTFPGVVVVETGRNLGFAEGCNVGARAARGELIVLLNNDAVPEPGWLAELVRALEPEDVAIAASVIHEARYPEGYALGTGTISVIGHPIPKVLAPDSPFYAPGTSMAFKRAIFPRPFDPLYFSYYEDTLLSWRARLKGHRVVRALGSAVGHMGSATAQRDAGAAAFYWERNKLLTLLLCYEALTIWRLAPLYVFDAMARVAEDLWLLAKRPLAARWPARFPPIPTFPRQGGRGPVQGRYRAAMRAVAWLLAHARTVGERRRAIQSQRVLNDRRITPMLSGKIFDDLVPTRGHRIANGISQRYCRWVGIVTAEEARRLAPLPQRPHPSDWRSPGGEGARGLGERE